MKYKIIDCENGYLMQDEIFNSPEEVRERLASFHSIDIENTDKMTLDDLLEIGNWELEQIKD